MPIDLVGALVGWLVSVVGDAGIRLALPSTKERVLRRVMGLAIDTVVARVPFPSQEALRAGLSECFSRPPQLRLDASINVGDNLRAAVAAQISLLDEMVQNTATGKPFYQTVSIDPQWISEQIIAAILTALRQVVAESELAELVHALDMAEVLARLEMLSSRGTVVHQYLYGPFRRLRHVTIDLDPLPGDLRLADPTNPLGYFTGRKWLIERIDGFINRCVAQRVGGYVLVEAEAGMGKSALATYLAFTRAWPTHVTRLPGGTSPEAARANLAGQVIARWELSDAVADGVLPVGHDTTAWLYQQLCAAARRRDEAEPGTPVVVLVDGLDEAPPVVPPQLPLGLPDRLPPGTVVVATTRPGTRLPAAMAMRVERIDVEGRLNREDLRDYLLRVTTGDPQVAQALARARMDREKFCGVLLERAGGVWIYALTVLDEIRDQRRCPADVKALPEGLAGYYAINITRWQSDPTFSWEDATLPLLATLAAARQPQSAAVLARWSGVELRAAKELLRGPFKAFLVARDGGDPDVYALRHQSLRDLLEGRLAAATDDQLRYLAHDLAETTRTAHGRIGAALVPDGDPPSRNWDAIDAYTRAYLAEHAALGGWLDELVYDPEFLLMVGVPELLRVRRHLSSTTGAAAVAALELASNSWNENHDDKLHWLGVSARKFRCAPLADAVKTRLNSPWHCRTALWSGTSHRQLTGHAHSVWAVAAVPLADGTTLVASAGADPAVRLGDPRTRARDKLTGHTQWVRAVATVPLADGTMLLASAGDDRAILLWESHGSGRFTGVPLPR